MSQNKKAVSLMVSYALLIIIAIGLAIGVYTWLKVYVPKEKPECPDGVAIIIKGCDYPASNQINIIFQNKGYYDIDGIYIRYSKTGSNKMYGLTPITEGMPDYRKLLVGVGYLPFKFPGGNNRGLEAGVGIESDVFLYEGTINQVRVEPFIIDSETNEIVICEGSIITQEPPCQ